MKIGDFVYLYGPYDSNEGPNICEICRILDVSPRSESITGIRTFIFENLSFWTHQEKLLKKTMSYSRLRRVTKQEVVNYLIQGKTN